MNFEVKLQNFIQKSIQLNVLFQNNNQNIEKFNLYFIFPLLQINSQPIIRENQNIESKIMFESGKTFQRLFQRIIPIFLKERQFKSILFDRRIQFFYHKIMPKDLKLKRANGNTYIKQKIIAFKQNQQNLLKNIQLTFQHNCQDLHTHRSRTVLQKINNICKLMNRRYQQNFQEVDQFDYVITLIINQPISKRKHLINYVGYKQAYKIKIYSQTVFSNQIYQIIRKLYKKDQQQLHKTHKQYKIRQNLEKYAQLSSSKIILLKISKIAFKISKKDDIQNEKEEKLKNRPQNYIQQIAQCWGWSQLQFTFI